MKRFPELKPNLWDALVVLAVAALAVGVGLRTWGGLGEAEKLTVVVSVDGAEVERFDPMELAQTEKTYSNNGYTLTVALAVKSVPIQSDQKSEILTGVCVTESDCPSQDCVHTGIITRAGQSIVCLPSRIVIELEGGPAKESNVDVVIG